MKKAAIIVVILVLVAAVILFLNGLHQRSGLSPSGWQIIRLSAAIESYKTDLGHCPTDPATTEQLKTNTTFDPAAYTAASAFLYQSLMGTSGKSLPNVPASNAKNYFGEGGIPKNWIKTNESGLTYFVDGWGNSLGYSTFKAVHPESRDGNNPSFDLWSTAGSKKQVNQSKWAKNW